MSFSGSHDASTPKIFEKTGENLESARMFFQCYVAFLKEQLLNLGLTMLKINKKQQSGKLG